MKLEGVDGSTLLQLLFNNPLPLTLPLGNIFLRICDRTSVLIQSARTARSYTVTAESGQYTKVMPIAPRW